MSLEVVSPTKKSAVGSVGYVSYVSISALTFFMACICYAGVILFPYNHSAVLSTSFPGLRYPLISNSVVNLPTMPQSSRRRLQFEGMFDVNPQLQQQKKHKRLRNSKPFGGAAGGEGPGSLKRPNRPAQLTTYIDEVLMGMDRYHQWWTGPEHTTTFAPAEWSASHSEYKNAIFTVAMRQGGNQAYSCTDRLNDFHLFLGSARRVFDGDMVVAVEQSQLDEDLKKLLISYRAIVYIISDDLCSKETVSIYCGSSDERVPSSVFRYYFYEKWASHYAPTALLLFADFRDVFFQSVRVGLTTMLPLSLLLYICRIHLPINELNGFQTTNWFSFKSFSPIWLSIVVLSTERF
jgi:hypothetical protein